MTSLHTKRYLVVGLLVIMAAPVALYWAIGDRSEGGDTYYLDYVVTPPGWSADVVAIAGAGATVLVIAGLGVLVQAVRRSRLDGQWLLVVACGVGVGAIVAFTYRVGTAGVNGANIGFGMLVTFGTPICLVLVAVAGTTARQALRRRSNGLQSPG
jgi:hypothetical protein